VSAALFIIRVLWPEYPPEWLCQGLARHEHPLLIAYNCYRSPRVAEYCPEHLVLAMGQGLSNNLSADYCPHCPECGTIAARLFPGAVQLMRADN